MGFLLTEYAKKIEFDHPTMGHHQLAVDVYRDMDDRVMLYRYEQELGWVMMNDYSFTYRIDQENIGKYGGVMEFLRAMFDLFNKLLSDFFGFVEPPPVDLYEEVGQAIKASAVWDLSAGYPQLKI